ncbi:hypothetical protein DSM104299_04398 [Baekduia alba]|uniref:sigma-70 family RNA polymerase sigma factor n=1 Tax=Baekduia alba TaxID=2997333 RepID=UPI00234063F9|nr:sigma-70 family RNA polymerase sigma factor [Baekduia alba]WCB95649.1 hypothetical protein DSM104299_04398 [Baekduia alba]
MENLAPARARLTDEQAQELVLRTVATHAESLLRVAYRHSLCADDAHDAYQRSMEILLRRAPTLDPRSVHKWLHVVVKHEAKELRRTRSAVVSTEDVDYDRHEAPDVSTPEERALTVDRATRAAEALQRLKPHELRAVWLKALGHSYDEIAEITGFSATKVNRCLAEGRKRFLERFEGIETGAECERWQPVLSAIVDGEATAAQMADARPHLRNCAACRATLRGLQDASPPLAAVLPVGLAGVGAKLSGLVERLVPGGADTVGGAGVLSAGGAKLAGVLAAGAVAVGGGTAAVHHHTHQHERPPAPRAARPAVVARAAAPRLPAATQARRAYAARATKVRHAAAAPTKAQHKVARVARSAHELKPRGHEVVVLATAPRVVATSTSSPSPKPGPVAVPVGPDADSSSGEFAPQP